MSNCTPIRWPGYRTSAWHRDQEDPEINTWYGGLVDGMRDASGRMYIRNRSYDPATGQFTQPDPIGLAGGLNSYGFAAGDPVSYSDPYGLSPSCDTKSIDKLFISFTFLVNPKRRLVICPIGSPRSWSRRRRWKSC